MLLELMRQKYWMFWSILLREYWMPLGKTQLRYWMLDRAQHKHKQIQHDRKYWMLLIKQRHAQNHNLAVLKQSSGKLRF
jgi:hypothetical protein